MMTTRVILTDALTGIGVQEIVSFIGLESVGRRAEKFEDRILIVIESKHFSLDDSSHCRFQYFLVCKYFSILLISRGKDESY